MRRALLLLSIAGACHDDDQVTVLDMTSVPRAQPAAVAAMPLPPVSAQHAKAVADTLHWRTEWLSSHNGCDQSPSTDEQAYLNAFRQLCEDEMVNVRTCLTYPEFRKLFRTVLDQLDALVAHPEATCQGATDAQLCQPYFAPIDWIDGQKLLDWAAAPDCHELVDHISLPKAR